MVNSARQDAGISVHVFSPLVQGALPLLDTSSDRIVSYSHEKAAVGGYLSASFTLSSTEDEIQDWFVNGLGRHIVVYNEAMVIVWEGFVNQIQASAGPLSLECGPLMDTSNRVVVVYQTKSYDPLGITIGGGRAATDPADHERAQGRYGILETVLTGGTGTEAEAERYRDTYLEESHEPESNVVLASGRGDSPSLTVNCLGYIYFLDRYHYTDTAGLSTQAVSAKITDVLDASPNSFFSTNYNRITANSFDVSEYEADEKTGWGIIKDLVAFGDVNDTRYTFRIIADRQAIYEPIPTEAIYQTTVTSKSGLKLERMDDGSPVMPWDIEPGQLVFISDFMSSAPNPVVSDHEDPRHGDPRYMFIETVQFNMVNNEFSLNGGKIGRLPQLLAKQGLGGSS